MLYCHMCTHIDRCVLSCGVSAYTRRVHKETELFK